MTTLDGELSQQIPSADAAPPADRGVWLGPLQRPLAGRVWTPPGGGSRSGVLLLPPAGYEYWTSYQTVRALAESLAQRGHLVLRVDYDGTGDSAGEQTDPDRWDAWQAAADHGVRALRDYGVEQVTLLGLRLGATIALLRGARLAADTVAAILPVASGRRYARELTMLSQALEPPPEAQGAVFQAGSVFTGELVAAVSGVDLATLQDAPARRVLVVEAPERMASGRLVEHLRSLGSEVTHSGAAELDAAFGRPAEEATVPAEAVEHVVDWIGSATPAPSGAPSPAPSLSLSALQAAPEEVTITWRGQTVSERFVRLGTLGLSGVLTRPQGDPLATVVFLNSGSEVHVGPGRAWVEYARVLAGHGYETLRVDFRGWGDSPDAGFAPGRPYDLHTWDDGADIVAALRALGRRRIVLAGLCAGAWVALRVATLVAVDGVMAINPQLYWQPGDPVEALMTTTRARRTPEIAHFKEHGARLEQTVEHPTAQWLSQLREAGAPILTLFARGDDGLEFLCDRLPVAWETTLGSGVVRVTEVDIDHPMHMHWRRHLVTDALLEFLATCSASAAD